MIDAYKIGVRIAMTSNASAVLGVIQRDLFGLNKAVDLTTGKLNMMKVAALGAMSVVAGGAVLAGMAKLVEHGDKLVEQQVKLRALGVPPQRVSKATAAAEQMAQQIRGTDPAHNLEMIRIARALFKDTDEAIAVTPALLKTQLVLGQYASGASSDQQLLMLAKALDIQGAFVKNGKLDTAAATRALAMGEAALTLTHGLLTGRILYQFTRMAGAAAASMNMRAYLKDFTEVMLGLGRTGGRGMQMAAKTFLGGQVSRAQVQQLEGLGLVNARDVIRAYGHYAIKSGTLKGYHELLTKGIAAWFHDIVVPEMKAHHITGKAAVLQALSSLPVTEQRLFSFLYTNWPQIGKFGDQFEKVLRVNQLDILQRHNLKLNIKDLKEAWEGLLQVLVPVAVQPTIDALHFLTGGILRLERAAIAHPEVAKVLLEVAAGLGALLVVLGTIAVGTAAASALGLLTGAGGLLALAVGIEALGKALPSIPAWLVHMAAGAAAGAAVGSVVPFVGTGIGAAVGAGIGLGVGIDQSGVLSAGTAPNGVTEDGMPIFGPQRTTEGTRPIHTHTTINLDGRTIAHVVTQHQERATPPTTTTMPDIRMSPTYSQPGWAQ